MRRRMSRLIDADALVPDFLVPTTANNTPCKRYVSMKQIHNAPTIEPERTGKWINVGDGNYICSECGCNPITYIGATRRLDNYMDLLDGLCPNCGRKMKMEDEE